MAVDSIASKSRRDVHLADNAIKKKREIDQKKLSHENASSRIQLNHQKANVRDIDDFLRLMTDAENFDFNEEESSLSSDFSTSYAHHEHGSSFLSMAGGGQQQSASDGQSKGKWLTEEGSEHGFTSNSQLASPLAKVQSNRGNKNYLNSMSNICASASDSKSLDLTEWQDFEIEMSHLGLVKLSVKLDDRGLCVKLNISEKNNAEYFWENEEFIARSLSHVLGKTVRMIRDEEY